RWRFSVVHIGHLLHRCPVTNHTRSSRIKPDPLIDSYDSQSPRTDTNDSRFHNLNRVADLNLLEPKTRSIIQTIIDRATQGGIPVMVFETFRSQERQAQLFAQGASTLKTVGVHHYGLACDIVKD